MMTAPIGVSKTPIDAYKESVFEFYSSGGDVVIGNIFEIWDTDDLSVVNDESEENTHLKYYSKISDSHYDFNNTYNPNDKTAVRNDGLKNGNTYYYRFATIGVDSQQSEYSDFLPILCLSTPRFQITSPLNGEAIKTSNYEAIVKYSQANGEKLNRVVFYIYDSLENKIKESNIIYSNKIEKQDEQEYGEDVYVAKYNIDRLLTGETYHINASGVTVNGMTIQSEDITFTTEYQKPETYSELVLENVCDGGYVRVSSKLISVEGEVYELNRPYNNENGNPSLSDMPVYNVCDGIVTDLDLDNSINLEDKCLEWNLWNQKFSVKDDNFVMRIWLNPTRLCHLNSGMSYAICSFGGYEDSLDGADGCVRRQKGFLVRWERIVENSVIKDLFSLSYLGEDKVVYKRSNKIEALNNLSEVLLYIKKDNDTLDLQLVPSKTKDNTLNWGGQTDVNYNRTSNIYYETSSIDEDLTDYDFVTQEEDISSILSVSQNTVDTICLYNAIFTHFNIDMNTSITVDDDIPTQWSATTIADCDFNGTINAGSIGKISDIPMSAFIFKHRELGKFDWVNLVKQNVKSIAGFNFSFDDFIVPNNADMEYALVPIYPDGSEGDYLIDTIHTNFDGVYVFDGDTSMKLLANVSYDTGARNVAISSIQPIGKKYPIVIQNGVVNYQSGGVSGTILNDGFYKTHMVDRFSIVKLVDSYTNFLVNGKAKILKDWNGNIWLVQIAGSPSITYNQSMGNGVIDISFSWLEQGQWDNQEDLYNNGIVDIL